MRPITANVHAEDQFSVPPNCRGSNWGFLVTSGGVVMLDTPMVPRTALEVREQIARKGEVGYTVNPHHNFHARVPGLLFPDPFPNPLGLPVGNPHLLCPILQRYLLRFHQPHHPKPLQLLLTH